MEISIEHETTPSEKSQLTPDGEICQLSNHPRATTSAALNTTSPDPQCLPLYKQMNILLVLALVGLVFGFNPCELNAFDNAIINVNTEYKLEKSGLNNDCDMSSSQTTHTIGITYCTPAITIDNDSTSIETRELNVIGCDFNDILPATTIAITEGIKTENDNEYDSGVVWEQEQPQTSHPTALAIDTGFNIAAIDSELNEFNDIGCILDINNNGIVVRYDIYLVCLFCVLVFVLRDQTTFFVCTVFVFDILLFFFVLSQQQENLMI